MVLLLGGLAFLQYYTSDKIALAASGAKVVTPEQARATCHGRPALRDVRPAEAARRRHPDRHSERLRHGAEPAASAVAVTQGLWNRLEPREVEGAPTSSSHIGNRDVAVMTIASFFSMLAAFLMRMGMWTGMMGGGRNRDSGGALPS